MLVNKRDGIACSTRAFNLITFSGGRLVRDLAKHGEKIGGVYHFEAVVYSMDNLTIMRLFLAREPVLVR